MNLRHLIPLPVAAFAAMFCAPVSGPAQSILQSASDYALLGGTLISVGGPGPDSITNGNVGLWSAATTNITGFPPATVTGITASGSAAAIIATGPTTTGQAYADVQKAHVGLAGMASSANVSNVNLGTMAPLFAGVYTFNGAAQQTGALILDAQGHNGVTWVFQIGTSLTTSVNSTVTFINLGTNGGSDLGVFWNAGAGITIGDNNTILGNYISGTSISFTGSTSTAGAGGARALALAAISFAGPGAINALGGPGGGDFSGGLAYDSNGAVVIVPFSGGSSGGGSTPTPTGNVLVSGSGTVTPGPLTPGTPFGTTSTTIAGNIADGTAPASLVVTTAIVTLTGTNTYTGGTTVSGGTLIAGSTNLPANQPVALSSNGSLNFNQPADGSFGGVISGAGSVTKSGAGALTITGANTYTGGTHVAVGTLVASTSTLPANQPVSVAGGSTLAFNQTANGTFGGTITGGGTVRKTGAGTLTLSQATAVTADVQAGSLYFTDGLGSTTVDVGGFLGGNGTINGNLINSGTVSPGNSPGTITVTGYYTQTSTGTLIIELASGTSFDHLVVNGAATLAGRLQVDTLAGFNPIGQSFTFLTAGGGVSGTFTTVDGTAIVTNRAATSAVVTYGANDVKIAFVQLPFAGFAQTPNQTAVGNGAQLNPAITAALDAVPVASQMPAALNALSPQGYEIWSTSAFARGTALADRLAQDARPVVDHDNYYFDVSQLRGRAHRDLDVGTSTYTSTSELVGGDRALTNDLAGGIFYEHGKTIAGLGSAGSHSNIEENMFGVRTAWASGPLFAHSMLGYGFDHYDSSRPIMFPGTNAVATSSTHGHQWLAGISGGENFDVGAVTLSPFVGLLASRWNVDGFTETGAGAFDATLGSETAWSLRSEAGLEAGLKWKFGTISLQPHVRAAWLHEYYDDARSMHASFGGGNFGVRTRGPQRDSAQVSTGLNVMLSPRALLYADYSAQNGGITKVLSEWRVGLVVRF